MCGGIDIVVHTCTLNLLATYIQTPPPKAAKLDSELKFTLSKLRVRSFVVPSLPRLAATPLRPDPRSDSY